MQVPIFNGRYTDSSNDIRIAYPINLIPTPVESGISEGYLRPSEGIESFSALGPGLDRGGVNWNGTMYRVMGSKFVSIASDGTITTIGDVQGSTDQCSLDYYGPTYLGIVSNKNMWLYDGTTLAQITDTDLGDVLDFIWIDGYYMTTDGTYIVVTELSDPFMVDPLKYGSAEQHPDEIKAILKIDNEPYIVGRYTIEVMENTGGTGFPFTRLENALIEKGSLGTHCCCVYMDSIAFLGSGEKEEPSIWLASNGETSKLSTREIDLLLGTYTEEVLAQTLMEVRMGKSHHFLYLHLPDQTLVYDLSVTKATENHIWFIYSSGYEELAQYRARNFVWCYNKWFCGDTETYYIGSLTTDNADHWGEEITWRFNTDIIFNENNNGIVHELELVTLNGRMALGASPMISTSYSLDGQVWSESKYISIGTLGNRTKRCRWLRQGNIGNWRIQRFEGNSSAMQTFLRLDARIEPLNI